MQTSFKKISVLFSIPAKGRFPVERPGPILCKITAPPNVSTRDIDLHQTTKIGQPHPLGLANLCDGKRALSMMASNRFDFPGESPVGLSSAIFNSLFSVFSQPIRLLLFRSCSQYPFSVHKVVSIPAGWPVPVWQRYHSAHI